MKIISFQKYLIYFYRMKSENLRRWTINIRHLSDVPVSRNWDKTVSKLYQNVYIRFRIKFVVINRPYSTITQPISKLLYPTGAWGSQICSCYNFLILFCIFNTCSWNYYYVLSVKSVLRHQNFHQWQCSKLDMWYSWRHVTTIQHCHWWKFWWHNTDYT